MRGFACIHLYKTEISGEENVAGRKTPVTSGLRAIVGGQLSHGV